MGTFIVKAHPDHDLYLEFDSYDDSVSAVGSYADVASWGVREYHLRNADEFGTSSKQGRGRGAYGETSLDIYTAETRDDGPHRLHRKDFVAYATLWLDGKLTEAEALLEPAPDLNE